MKKKILILGSNSFSGNHLARYLLDKKYFVIGCSLSDQSKPKFNSLMQVSKKNRSNFKFEKVNINKNLNKIKKIFSKKYKPYEIGYISNDKKKVCLSGKIKW